MANKNESVPQRAADDASNINQERQEQFNELSELSLEERMNVADQLGVPASTVSDAASLGIAGVEPSERSTDDDLEEERSTS